MPALQERKCATRRSEEFDGEALGTVADRDDGEERVIASADDGEIAGSFVDDEKHGRLGAGCDGIEAHGTGGSADGEGFGGATIEDVERDNATGGAIGDVHFGSIIGEDGVEGSGAEKHGVCYFVGPSVNGLQAVGFRRDDVEFAAIGLKEHLRRAAGEFEISEEHAAAKIHDREASLRAAHDEGDGTVGKGDDLVGERDDGDDGVGLQGGSVVNGESGGVLVDDEEKFVVGSDADLNGLRAGVGAADDGAGGAVDGEELVGGGGGGEDAIARGGEVKRVRKPANGNARGELIGARVEDPEIAAGAADAPDFVAFGMLEHLGEHGPGRDARDLAEIDKIDDGDGAVGGRDVGVDAQAGAEEGGAVLTEKNARAEDEQEGEEKVLAEVLGGRHGVGGF
jgi:hypothetical protein